MYPEPELTTARITMNPGAARSELVVYGERGGSALQVDKTLETVLCINRACKQLPSYQNSTPISPLQLFLAALAAWIRSTEYSIYFCSQKMQRMSNQGGN